MNANQMSAAVAIEAQPLLDPERIALLGKLRGGALLPQLLRTYRDQSSQQVAQLQEAAAASDLEAIRRISHNMKSASYSIGANSLGELCGRIENSVRAGEPVDPRAACQMLGDLHRRVLDEITVLQG